MIEAQTVKLSTEILDALSIDDIIYAEFAGGGAMGNSGGVMFYCLAGEIFTLYEASIFEEPALWERAVDILRCNQIHHNTESGIFRFYYGGVGNYVYIQKDAVLKIAGEDEAGYFIYRKGNREYAIYSSVYGVYRSVVFSMMGERFRDMPDNLKTIRLCFEAVTRYDQALEDVPLNLRTAELCLEAVRRYGLALQYVPENFKTAELCFEAVRKDGLALEFTPENFKTAELCFEAVRKDGLALEFTPENFKTAELCIKAVRKNGAALQYTPENLITVEFCHEAIRRSGGLALQYIPERLKTAKLCLKAVKKDGAAFQYVPESLKTPELRLKAALRNGAILPNVPES